MFISQSVVFLAMLLSLDVMLVMSTVLRSGGLDVDKRVIEVVTFVAAEVVVVVAAVVVMVVVVVAARIMVVAATVVVVRLVMMTEVVLLVWFICGESWNIVHT